MLNYVCIMGRITHDLELKTVGSSNLPYLGFSIAVDSGYGDSKKTYFIDCVAWRKTAEFISKYFEKGSRIAIQGNIITDVYRDKNDIARKATRINITQADFCESKNSKPSSVPQPPELSEQDASLGPSYSAMADADDDLLPF